MNRVSIRPTFPHSFAFTFRALLLLFFFCVCARLLRSLFLRLIISWILRAVFCLICVFHLGSVIFSFIRTAILWTIRRQPTDKENPSLRAHTHRTHSAEISKKRYSIPAEKRKKKRTNVELEPKTNWMENDADTLRRCKIASHEDKKKLQRKKRKMRKYLVVTFFMLLMQNSCVFLMQDNFLHFYFVLFVRIAFTIGLLSFVKIFLQTFSILFSAFFSYFYSSFTSSTDHYI